MASPDKILIVDDDPEICHLLSTCLAPLEYKVTSANDGSQALEWIEAEQFNIVILDLMLPGPNGIDILRHIHKRQPETDVIVLTAYASLETAIEALRLGAYDYITKPFQIEAIRSTVRRAVEKQHLETSLAAIYDLSREMTLSSDVGQVAGTTLDIAGRLSECEICSLWLIDEERDELRRLAARGTGQGAGDKGQGETHRLPLSGGKGVIAAVARSGKPLYVPDAREDSLYTAAGAATRSELAVPLKVKGRVTGVLNIESTEVNGLSQGDMRLLSTLAAQAAVAIENVRLFEQVRAGRERLQALSSRLVDAQEAERSHIARELHDETGQALSSLLLGLSLLEQEADRPEAVIAHVTELEGMAVEMLENLHRLAMNLRPAALDHLGLVAALDQYVETFSRQHDISVQFEAVGLAGGRPAAAVETAFYRIVQEALTNIVRHAQATRVDVLLERRGDQVVILIEDDGVGFDPKAAMQSGRMGLFGMRERAERLGGTLVIESGAGTGTTVLVEVPYVRSSAEA